jgi:hypothetical protein
VAVASHIGPGFEPCQEKGAVMSKCAVIAVLLLALVATPALAQDTDLSGRYRIEGANPGGGGRYEGQVEIVRTGQTYQVRWTIGGRTHLGTGIARDGGFAVVYQPEAQAPGIAFYRIQANGALAGSWTSLGGKALGSEILHPRDRL